MKRELTFLATAALLWGVVAPCAHAQRGMGESAGVVWQAVKPKVLALSGKVLTVKTEPCKATTGRAAIGTHFLLETPEGEELNIHVGPAVAVDYVADQLPIGDNVIVNAFRTASMPEKHYVAQSLAFDDTSIQLRDESLRPLWARGDAVSHRLGEPQWGPGRGPGRGWGRGPGYGRGAGWRRGSCYRWSRGAVGERGVGFDRGCAFVDEDRDGICDNYERFWRER
jgi:hypothetical protein